MAVDLRKVKKLIELVEESGIAELEVSSGDETVRIAMHSQGFATQVLPTSTPQPASPVIPEITADAAATVAPEVIEAPMAGTFYRAPNPEAAAFVEVGDHVDAGQVVCIIESMKMMHEIKATQSGTIAQIYIANGQPIGTRERLFRLS